MEKIWAGRTDGNIDAVADDFNSSIRVDSRMARQDITGSMAHAAMLGRQGIIPQGDAEKIIACLGDILADIEEGRLAVDPKAEDIHSFVEATLTERIGDAGKKLHTARSRNDQVALDTRMYLRDEAAETVELICDLIRAIRDKAAENAEVVMPGYTHLQRAQPVSFAHHILAYAMMLIRDAGRIEDAARRMNLSPLGACALAGTTFPLDRNMTAKELGFDGPTLNSIDSVSDRDFCIELLGALSILMMHLSRFSEEIILWSSSEFGYVELDNAYSTGSSIMPQKKNPDMAELCRGKTGRVYGDLITLLTVMKGIPLAYNKDMQEDKEATFDGFDTAKVCLRVFAPMICSMKVRADRMAEAARGGFITATDLADYLAKRGVPFRTAYKLTGQIVAYCVKEGITADMIPLEKYKEFSPVFDADLYPEIDPLTCMKKRLSEGGTAPESVMAQIGYVDSFLER